MESGKHGPCLYKGIPQGLMMSRSYVTLLLLPYLHYYND